MPRPRKKSDSFDPGSPDAMFATILQRLDQQDRTTEQRHTENKSTLEEIKEQTTLTNGRVTKLESREIGRSRYLAGLSAGAAAVGSAVFWLIKLLVGHRG